MVERPNLCCSIFRNPSREMAKFQDFFSKILCIFLKFHLRGEYWFDTFLYKMVNFIMGPTLIEIKFENSPGNFFILNWLDILFCGLYCLLSDVELFPFLAIINYHFPSFYNILLKAINPTPRRIGLSYQSSDVKPSFFAIFGYTFPSLYITSGALTVPM